MMKDYRIHETAKPPLKKGGFLVFMVGQTSVFGSNRDAQPTGKRDEIRHTELSSPRPSLDYFYKYAEISKTYGGFLFLPFLLHTLKFLNLSKSLLISLGRLINLNKQKNVVTNIIFLNTIDHMNVSINKPSNSRQHH